jgi:hypothetical protein
LYTLQTGTTYYPYTLSTPREPPSPNTREVQALPLEARESPLSDLSSAAPRPPRAIADRRVYTALPEVSQLGLADLSGVNNGVVFPFRRSDEVRLMKYYLEYMCNWVGSLSNVLGSMLLDTASSS